jgi:hypothetical protein
VQWEMEEHQSNGEAAASRATKVTDIMLVRSTCEEGDFFLCALVTSACVDSSSSRTIETKLVGSCTREVLNHTCVLSEGQSVEKSPHA